MIDGLAPELRDEISLRACIEAIVPGQIHSVNCVVRGCGSLRRLHSVRMVTVDALERAIVDRCTDGPDRVQVVLGADGAVWTCCACCAGCDAQKLCCCCCPGNTEVENMNSAHADAHAGTDGSNDERFHSARRRGGGGGGTSTRTPSWNNLASLADLSSAAVPLDPATFYAYRLESLNGQLLSRPISRPLAQLFAQLLARSLARSITQPLSQLLSQPLIYSLSQPLTHSLTHSLAHSLT